MMMEARISGHVDAVVDRTQGKMLDKRVFRAKVAAVAIEGRRFICSVVPNGQSQALLGVSCAVPRLRPRVGDDVECMWRDKHSAVIVRSANGGSSVPPWTGSWNPTTHYPAGALVSYDGSLVVANRDNINSEPMPLRLTGVERIGMVDPNYTSTALRITGAGLSALRLDVCQIMFWSGSESVPYLRFPDEGDAGEDTFEFDGIGDRFEFWPSSQQDDEIVLSFGYSTPSDLVGVTSPSSIETVLSIMPMDSHANAEGVVGYVLLTGARGPDIFSGTPWWRDSTPSYCNPYNGQLGIVDSSGVLVLQDDGSLTRRDDWNPINIGPFEPLAEAF